MGAHNQSSASSIAVSLPSAPTSGNLMIACIGTGNLNSATASLSGWTAIDVVGNPSQQTFYRTVQTGDGTTYTFSTSGSNGLVSAQIIEITGQNPSTPIHMHASAQAVIGSVISTASLTPSILGCLPLSFFSVATAASPGSWTKKDSTWTEIQNIVSTTQGSCESQHGQLTTDTVTAITGQVTLANSRDCEAALILVAPAPVATSVTIIDNLNAVTDYAGRQIQELIRTTNDMVDAITDTAARATSSFIRAATDSLGVITDSAARATSTLQRLSGDYTNGPSFIYMIGQDAIATIAADTEASALLNNTTLYIILNTKDPSVFPNPAPSTPSGWTPTWVYRWTSEELMASDLAAGIPSYITVAMYDNEVATQPPTPEAETDNPPYYVGLAANLAHSQSPPMTFIATGGLVVTNPQNYPGGQPQEIIDYWKQAVDFDGYAMQTQTNIANPSTFLSEIQSLAQHALAATPVLITIFSVGVGDFSGGTLVDAPQIAATMALIPQATTGLSQQILVWMNFGIHAGPLCTDPNQCPIPTRYDMIPEIIKAFGSASFSDTLARSDQVFNRAITDTLPGIA